MLRILENSENSGRRYKMKFTKMLKRVLSLSLMTSVFMLGGCAGAPENKTDEKIVFKSLLLPHFESGEMTGDFGGEAQLSYEEYFMESEKITLKSGYELYVNRELGTALCVTGSGKTNMTACLTALLSDSRFDFTNAKIITYGCAGCSAGAYTMGDTCVITAACDYDLGHTADARDMQDKETDKLWFYDESFVDVSHKKLNRELCDRVYELVKDIPMETTELTRKVMAECFDNAEWAVRDPKVLKGTSMSSDNFWKGEHGHNKAIQIAEFYGCEDPYAMTEMEDVCAAVVAEQFGLLDNLIIVRTGVNSDVFVGTEGPESLWGNNLNFNNTVNEVNSETLDIFETGMNNMFKVIKKINDAVLDGTL